MSEQEVQTQQRLVLVELLREFTEQEPEEPMLLFLAKPLHTAILHFWPEISSDWEQPEGPYPNKPAERWDWLWAGVDYDLENLAARVGAPEYLVRSRVALFAAWRWILPDGSVAPKIAVALAAWRKTGLTQSQQTKSKPN